MAAATPKVVGQAISLRHHARRHYLVVHHWFGGHDILEKGQWVVGSIATNFGTQRWWTSACHSAACVRVQRRQIRAMYGTSAVSEYIMG